MKLPPCRVQKSYNKSIKEAVACLSKDEKDEAMKLMLIHCPYAEKHPEEVALFLAFTQNYMVLNSLPAISAANISFPFVWRKIVIDIEDQGETQPIPDSESNISPESESNDDNEILQRMKWMTRALVADT
eukprot:IDg1672t1